MQALLPNASNAFGNLSFPVCNQRAYHDWHIGKLLTLRLPDGGKGNCQGVCSNKSTEGIPIFFLSKMQFLTLCPCAAGTIQMPLHNDLKHECIMTGNDNGGLPSVFIN